MSAQHLFSDLQKNFDQKQFTSEGLHDREHQSCTHGSERIVESYHLEASPDTQLSQLPPGARVVEPSRYIRGDSPTPARSMYGTGVGGIDPGRTFGGSTTAPVTSSAYAAKPLYGTTLGLNNRDTSPLYDRKLYGTGLNGTEIWKARDHTKHFSQKVQ
eukprot:1072457-Amphidinium_carterae.1